MVWGIKEYSTLISKIIFSTVPEVIGFELMLQAKKMLNSNLCSAHLLLTLGRPLLVDRTLCFVAVYVFFI